LPIGKALAGQIRKNHGYDNRYSTYGRFNYFYRLCWGGNNEQEQWQKKIVKLVHKGCHRLLIYQPKQTTVCNVAANKNINWKITRWAAPKNARVFQLY
jgi:hypothetical protein